MKKKKLIFPDLVTGRREGFTLFEIFLALLILTLAIIPMLSALAPALLSTSQEEESAVLTGRARQTMNRLLDMDYSLLDAHKGNPVDLAVLLGGATEIGQETLVHKGRTYTPVVAITDASLGKGGLLELEVTLGTVRLRTLRAVH